MSLKGSQKDIRFDQFKADYFKCITEVLQLFVGNLYTDDIRNVEKDLTEVWGSSEVHRMFMDIQRPIIHEGNISKMNIATCYVVLQNACILLRAHSDMWKDHSICGNSLEDLITAMVYQLIDVAYSKYYIDNIQQNEQWDKLIEMINQMYGVVVDHFHNIDIEFNLSALLQRWSIREGKKEEIDLSEYMPALDFIVRREIIEYQVRCQLSFTYFCPKKMFSKFKISHLHTDELISYTDIFDWKDKDDQFPQMYVIFGQKAAGKSLYMKYVYQQFGKDSSFIGINKFELIIFIESSTNSADSLVEYIDNSLQEPMHRLNLHTFEVQEIMLRGKLLVMMDSFDVATTETYQLLNEITTLSTNNISLMIATRSDCLNDLCKKLPKTKKTLILYPVANASTSVDNECQGQRVGIEGVTASCTVSLEIPPGYETSTVSKVLMNANQLATKFSNCEIVTINDEKPGDKKKPSARTIKKTVSKLNILIEHLCTATAQLSNYESAEERCQLQEILDEYEELYKEADALNKKLPPGMCTVLYTSGESIFWGISYWFEQLCREPRISRKILDEMDDNYSKVKNHLHPKPKMNLGSNGEMPSIELVMASMSTLTDLLEQAKEAVTMIENSEGRTDKETKIMLRELVIDIRNFREKCDSFNASLPKIVMHNYLHSTNHIGLFAGLDYWFRDLTKKLDRGQEYQLAKSLVQELDEADKKIRNHLLNPEPIQPKLVKSWKTEVISTNKKKNVKKANVKKKCKTGW